MAARIQPTAEQLQRAYAQLHCGLTLEDMLSHPTFRILLTCLAEAIIRGEMLASNPLIRRPLGRVDRHALMANNDL
jgi:hypothetical protein